MDDMIRIAEGLLQLSLASVLKKLRNAVFFYQCQKSNANIFKS